MHLPDPHRQRDLTRRWALLTAGAFVTAVAVNTLAVPNGLIFGGVSGAGLLLHYRLGGMSPAAWYLLLNVPVFAAGWLLVGRNFFVSSLYGMACLTLFMAGIDVRLPMDNPLPAALAAGALTGLGMSLCLASGGSQGGMDILAVYCRRRFGTPMGRVYLSCDALVFATGFFVLDLPALLASLLMAATLALTVDALPRLARSAARLTRMASRAHAPLVPAMARIRHARRRA